MAWRPIEKLKCQTPSEWTNGHVHLYVRPLCPSILYPNKYEIWSADYQENHSNFCHQMSHFKAKMHQIWFHLFRWSLTLSLLSHLFTYLLTYLLGLWRNVKRSAPVWWQICRRWTWCCPPSDKSPVFQTSDHTHAKKSYLPSAKKNLSLRFVVTTGTVSVGGKNSPTELTMVSP